MRGSDTAKDAGTGMTPIPAEAAMIVAHYGVAVEVAFPGGERRTVRVKRNSGHVVGDYVTVSGETLERLPRRTELRRRDARGSVRLVAANLDTLGVVLAPASPTGFADRAIIAARAADLAPFLVVNKCDLPESRQLAAMMRDTYGSSTEIFSVSAVRGDGLDDLHAFLAQGHRGAFVGSTGVGKSSLLNALIPDIDLKVGALSEYHGMGRHTTTVSTLHQVPGGGELVDTPGFREFGLVEIFPEDVVAHFPGFEDLEEGACRFHNCRHRREPGCAVMALVEEGALSAERYERYLEILQEAEAEEQSAQRRAWKNPT
ncbi:ribosome small subunit-dependent GTPase A [Geomonas sp. RF6]|uniref:ribosome small subunit-dependent GTPase A n=1 Tax=Geomonas sp. RF6 TaxID=2897342 RepID=UPI001E516105|nr:ribosome small subunit-dependent GTPase A [Geomonas sp. RF6]UFS69231.1 ribosome small subunit-dependent GTPase A [Geomonas sp. RF6]